MKGKKKIIVYADWRDNFEELTNEELGKLMRHFFNYINDDNPILEDRLLKIAWKPIEATLKRDLKSWESFVEKQKANGKKGGRPKSQKTQAFEKEPKKADSDSDSDSDSVKDNDKDREREIHTPDDEIYKSIQTHYEEYKKLKRVHQALVKNKDIPCNTKQEVLEKLDEFQLNLEGTGDTVKTFKDYKTHFLNWLKKQKEKSSAKKEKVYLTDDDLIIPANRI